MRCAMKKLLLLFVLAGSLTTLSAQNPYISVPVATDGTSGLQLPQTKTVLAVDLDVAQERVLAGPYARYAQRFLGVVAPMTDKEQWSVRAARVGVADPVGVIKAGELAEDQIYNVMHATSEEDFPRLQIDKSSIGVVATEAAAESAARMIFSLRHHRMELITGEAGENVFGAGLKAALDEIARLEQGYLELFLGKRVVRSSSRRFLVYLEPDKKQYVVARFNAQSGLLPESDLSGDMVLLQIDPAAVNSALRADEKARSVIECRVAASSTCTVLVGATEYGRNTLPIMEFGETIPVPVRATK